MSEVTILFERAVSLIGGDENDLRTSLRIIENLLEEDLEMGLELKCFIEKSNIFVRLGQGTVALDIIDSALERHVHNVWAHLKKAEIFASIGRQDMAVTLLHEVVTQFGCSENNIAIFNCFTNIQENLYVSRVDRYRTKFESGSPLWNVLLVYLIKDEEDVIQQNLEHHYDMGFRNFVVVDNDSNDNTPNILEKFRSKYSDALVLILHDPVVGYYQKEKTNAAANYGRSIAALVGRAIDWILPLDGDEFLCPGHELDFAQLFCEATQAGYQIIAFNWSNVATSDINSPISSDDNLFLRFDLRHTRPPMNIFKIAAHVGINPVFDNGNHYTLDSYQYLKTTLSASKYGASMMHMHMRNAAHVLCKIIKGGKAFEAAPELKFGCHWKDWYSRYKMYGDVVAMEFLNNYLKQFSRPD